MAATYVSLSIYHGGTITPRPNLGYVGGLEYSLENFDVEYLSVPHLIKEVKSFGYKHEIKMWYKFSNEGFSDGLVQLSTDEDVIELIARATFVPAGTRVEIYAEHGLDMDTCEFIDALPAPPVERDEISMDNNEGIGLGNDDEEEEVNGQDDDDDEDFVFTDFVETDEDEDDDVLYWSNVDANVHDIGIDEGNDLGDVDSEYADSDELRSLSSSASDDDALRKLRSPNFNESSDINAIELKVGMLFSDHIVFREALREYAIKVGFEYDLLHNDKERVHARCKRKCGWHVWASMSADKQAFQIKTLTEKHKCGRQQKNDKCNVKWLCKKYLETIRDNPDWDITAFQQAVKREQKIYVSKIKCYRAKRMAKDIILGKEKEQYAQLWDYCHAVLKWNPGSTVQMRLDDVRCFQRLYICLDACKKGFLAGCRPIIGLDACHLKGGLPGQLLCAVGKDANDNIFPIAYAVCEAETKETWSWFLDLLTKDIGTVREKGWTFISDRQKGLVESLKDIVHDDDNRFCLRHMYNNFNKEFKGKALKDALWNAARATTEPKFKLCMEKLKELDNRAYEWACKEKPQAWSRHGFNPKVKCDMLLNNVAETFNSYISKARDKPIITMFEVIRSLLMKRFRIKREGMKNSTPGGICPRIQTKLEFSKAKSADCICEWGGGPRVEVDHCFDGKQVVNVEERTCTCRRWDLTGIPCSHACAAIYFVHNKQPEEFVNDYYRTETFLAIYDPMIHPIPGPEYWPKTQYEPVLPPPYRRKPGRPKRTRRKEPDEPKNPSKLSRVGTKLTCGKCGQAGHNARKCNGIVDPKRASKMKIQAEKVKARRNAKKIQSSVGRQTRAQTRASQG